MNNFEWLTDYRLKKISPDTLLLMMKQAKNARGSSYSPYSKFKVGCSILSEGGLVTCGTNFENQLYSKTVHAEVNAIGQMITMRERLLRCVFIASSNGVKPCVDCRKVISEFCDKDIPIVLINTTTGEVKIHTIYELAPTFFKLGQLKLL